MPAKVYTDKDADLGVFKNKTLAVLGYGSQGHAHALNLKDSGCKVIIGLYPGSKSRAVAAQHGFEVFDTAEAVRLADVIMIGLPDMRPDSLANAMTEPENVTAPIAVPIDISSSGTKPMRPLASAMPNASGA